MKKNKKSYILFLAFLSFSFLPSLGLSQIKNGQLFVAKFDSTGERLWALNIASSNFGSAGLELSIQNDTSLCVIGYLKNGPKYINSKIISDYSNSEVVELYFSNEGEFQKIQKTSKNDKKIGLPKSNNPNSIVEYYINSNINGQEISSTLIKYFDTKKNWSLNLESVKINSVFQDNKGNVYITGEAYSDLSLKWFDFQEAQNLSKDNILSLFPNPNNGSFVLSFNLPIEDNDLSKINFSVLNSIGTEIKHNHNIKGNKVYSDLLNTGNLNSGIYFLKFTFNGEEIVKKFFFNKD